jgi:endoglucanase
VTIRTRRFLPGGGVGKPSCLRRAILLTAVIALALVASNAALAGAAALPPPARSSAVAFLNRYVAGDGRVVRRDQGNDTVSAGQAQGMLLAAALGQRGRFALVWRWAEHHLQLGDGLLASRWVAGRVANGQPASDADLDAARALLVAAGRFGVGAYRAAGLRIARAVLANETVARGRLRVLVAGPWARGRALVDPGYWAPRTLAQLRTATGDVRFSQLESSAITLTAELTASPPHLPSDWAAVSAGGAIHPIAAPQGHVAAPPQYSIDAARVPIRFAESCLSSAHRIAASLWPFFSGQAADRIGASYALDGTVTNPDQTATTLVGAAAAALAAHQSSAASALMAQAQRINNRFPTYFGAAWIAVAQVELDSNALGACG